MPRVIVTTDPTKLPHHISVLLDEQVQTVHLSSGHAAAQLVERIAWAISDAEDADHGHADQPLRPSRRPRWQSSAARSRGQRRVRA